MQNNRQVKSVSGGGTIHSNLFYHITSEENLLHAWKEFKKGKINKNTIQEFEFNLESNIIELSKSLRNCTYKISAYQEFYVYDPKKRHIHAAIVRDRIVHQAIYRIINNIFEPIFIHDSFSCRLGKGTHGGINRLNKFLRQITKNYSQEAFVLKCDISKFFDSIDHSILRKFIKNKIEEVETLNLLDSILNSFEKSKGKGVPLGNVTSQLFGNIYMHYFDFYVKHILKEKYYIRYCDDFVIAHKNKQHLVDLISQIEIFLHKSLFLTLHPRKREIRKVSQGIDFLGYVLLPHYKVLRTNTKKRIIRKIKKGLNDKQKASYLGVLSHAETYLFKKNHFD